MKKNRIAMLFLPLLALMVGCNLQEPVAEQSPEPQLLASPSNADYCQDCGNGCILGYDFTTDNIDGNHPQGGYKVVLVSGDCECVGVLGSWCAQTNGTATTSVGQTGGPGSGSIGTLSAVAQQIWGFTCSANSGPGGVIGTLGSWNDWLAFVETTHTSQDPTIPIGLHTWSPEWGIGVTPVGESGTIRVSLSKPDQASGLTAIRILENNRNTPLVEIPGIGEYSYDLDLRDLANGVYVFELEFAQGFTLSSTLQKD